MEKIRRKDTNGQILNTREYQRPDGRYSYSYVDRNGKRRCVYGKTLKELRQKEINIQYALQEGVSPGLANHITLNELYERYMDQKYDLKASTKAVYQYMYDRFVRPSFGNRVIGKIRYSDIRNFYYSLILEHGLHANTLDNIQAQLHPTFTMAVRDGLLSQNPCSGVTKEIRRSHVWENNTRHALTKAEQDRFMQFLQKEKCYEKWIPILTVLLGTGLRIGECLALRWEDLDMNHRIIHVRLSLANRQFGNGHTEKHISAPKTSSGIRTIPMLDEVYAAFLAEKESQSHFGGCVEVIDGYSGFIFANRYGNVFSETSINRAIDRIRIACNLEEEKEALLEGREPLLVPHFSAHHLRHTFCTRMVENEINVAILREIMGHRTLSTTLEVYTTISNEKKKESLLSLKGKIL
ncbi:MAG: site-specific integrase [Anaerotignum sp.]|nr:site-specific integrase [Anaerotignum sp.]